MWCIFRRSDGVVLYVAHTVEQLAAERVVCVACEGGVEADYITVEMPDERPVHTVPNLTPDGQGAWIPNPIWEAKVAAKAEVKVELMRLGLSENAVSLISKA